MNRDQIKELVDRLPFLYPRNVWTGKPVEDYDYDSIWWAEELPQGWRKLFLQCCEDIGETLKKTGQLNTFRFNQVKEKYNTMRMYHQGTSREVQDILNKYEYLSNFVCQKCGKPAQYETEGWITSYCTDCCPDKKSASALEFSPTFTLYRYSKDGVEEQVIDCSSEWDRYLESGHREGFLVK